MKAFVQGAILGSVVTAAAVAGYAYGTNQSNQTMQRPGTEIEAETLGYCRVDVGYGRITAGDSCFGNEVVTGSRSGYLLCSSIRVSCD